MRSWLGSNADDLAKFTRRTSGALELAVEREQSFNRALYDSGFARWGWPVEHGGLGGSALLRAVLYEELTAAGFEVPETFAGLEVIAPMLIRYAPQLATAHLPAKLRGDEHWCQGFSEPDAGSDLASLRTRAVIDGDAFRVNGQKIWTTSGHLSRWCALLARTGEEGSRHRGLTMLWLDLKSPGVTVRPIGCASDRNEVSEIFLDDVVVPHSNLVGEIDHGWDAVMYLMQFERGGYAWLRQAWLHARLADALAAVPRGGSELDSESSAAVGDAWLALAALRERVWLTVNRLAADEPLGPEISVDKLLLSGAEQAVFDTARILRGQEFELGDDNGTMLLRQDWYFSRIVSIYGGAAEVQRNVVAERLLKLPRSR